MADVGLRQRPVRELFARDLPIHAGTDTGTPFMVPGFALHDELELLVGAGATPQQALKAATVEPPGSSAWRTTSARWLRGRSPTSSYWTRTGLRTSAIPERSTW
ncbi:hypothetical protein [Kribbella sp. VKM Ac-2500]|uniref:hypothetical protein n=1 Tax=Kribbella sp. VKM Ac-2500 TaxID=2512214 RepID=UPI001F5408F6|nr:hypothetical protein [Kribbella sp. VKM Ac-2500]